MPGSEGERMQPKTIRFPISSLKQWEEQRKLPATWGWRHNIEWHVGGEEADFMRIKLPRGLAGTMTDLRRRGLRSGAGFHVPQGVTPADNSSLKYKIRFPNNFQFVKGGKLPGLYGGTAPTGGQTADGFNGFTSRLMWREEGKGEGYLYAPHAENLEKGLWSYGKYGISIGKGSWKFLADGIWHEVTQELQLNSPSKADGIVRIYYDDMSVVEQNGIVIRKTDDLKINGLCVSVFFGGDDASWASPIDTHVDFKDFEMLG